MPGQRMGALNRPVHVVGDMVEKLVAGTGFKMRKYLTDKVCGNHR